MINIISIRMLNKDFCANCGQGFLFPMDKHICKECEKAFQEKIDAELFEMACADLFDETCSDLPPNFPISI